VRSLVATLAVRGVAEVGVALAALLATLLAGAAIFALHGRSPVEVYAVFFAEVLASPGGLSQVTFKATTLAFTGLAAAAAFRAGLFNIGGEGQLYLGAFAAALLGLALPASTPAALAVPALLLAAALGGALAALVPATLRAARGTHEVINTMMMNFIVIAAVNWGLGKVRESPEVVHTAALPEAWRLLRFVRGFDGNTSAALALVAALALLHLLARTRVGFELEVLGKNPSTAEAAGVPVARRLVLALCVSGALAGLGGVNFVLGSPGYFEQHFAPFQGYLGVAVALLARSHPLGVLPAAALFAVLGEGAQAVQGLVPKEVGVILQGIVVVLVVVGMRAVDELRARDDARRASR
jgi:ABC-type uncharacterized transport system permease subunit